MISSSRVAATKNFAQQPGSRPRQEQARAEKTKPGTTRFRDGSATARPQKLRRGSPARARGPDPRKRASFARANFGDFCPNFGFEQQNNLETRGKHRELKRKLSKRAPTQPKARAREEPSPGPPASETDARPPGHQPRGGAPARPRFSRGQGGRPRKRANLACSKICDFGPELRFEQRNRFRSLRDTRRTEKKVLRKPPAARPVVGQTFKYIY